MLSMISSPYICSSQILLKKMKQMMLSTISSPYICLSQILLKKMKQMMSSTISSHITSLSQTVMLALLRPYIIAIPGDRTPNLTTITVTTNHYTPYPMQCHWSRLSHSLMAVHLMFTSCQILHHAYRTALHLGTSCISSLLYDLYLASCLPHVSLMTRTHPIGYDPLI